MDLHARLTAPALLALLAGCGAVEPEPTPGAECEIGSKRLILSHDPLAFDAEATLTVAGATAGAPVTFFWTADPTEDCTCPLDDASCLDLAAPEALGTVTADATGRATLTVRIPPDAPVGERRIQAAQESSVSAAVRSRLSGELARDLVTDDAEYAVHGAGLGLSLAAIGDADGDGRLEIASADPSRGTVRIVEPADAPRVDLPTGIEDLTDAVLVGPTGFGSAIAGPGDLTGDGVPDLLVAAAAAETIWLVPGPLPPGETHVEALAVETFTGWRGARDLAITDLDGDWKADVVVAGADRVWISTGGDLEMDAELLDLVAPDVSPAGDLDADGLKDLIVASGDEILLYYGPDIVEIGPSIADARVAATGDVDGDGYDDALVGSPSALGGKGTVALLRGPLSPAIPLLEGDTVGEELGISVLGAGDLDGDGLNDVAATSADGSVVLLYGPPGGTRSSVQADVQIAPTATSAGSAALGPGDVDGDDYDDLVLATGSDGLEGALFVFRGAPGW